MVSATGSGCRGHWPGARSRRTRKWRRGKTVRVSGPRGRAVLRSVAQIRRQTQRAKSFCPSPHPPQNKKKKPPLYIHKFRSYFRSSSSRQVLTAVVVAVIYIIYNAILTSKLVKCLSIFIPVFIDIRVFLCLFTTTFYCWYVIFPFFGRPYFAFSEGFRSIKENNYRWSSWIPSLVYEKSARYPQKWWFVYRCARIDTSTRSW